MQKSKPFLFLIMALATSTAVLAQNSKPAAEYLSVPGPVSFENKAYNLNWTSHPATNYYKQEYIVKGDDADKYKSMILLDVITGEVNIKNVLALKIAELKRMKEENPLVNYEVISNPSTGEYMLDFLVSANAANGSISIIERNVYRYKMFTDKAGHKGVVLFGVSTRAYGPGVTPFLAALKLNRKDLVSKAAHFKMPDVGIRN